MSKNTDEIVFKILPQEKRMDYGYVDCQLALKKAINEGKLVVPLTKVEIWNILAEGKSLSAHGKADISEAIYHAQFGGNK